MTVSETHSEMGESIEMWFARTRDVRLLIFSSCIQMMRPCIASDEPVHISHVHCDTTVQYICTYILTYIFVLTHTHTLTHIDPHIDTHTLTHTTYSYTQCNSCTTAHDLTAVIA